MNANDPGFWHRQVAGWYSRALNPIRARRTRRAIRRESDELLLRSQRAKLETPGVVGGPGRRLRCCGEEMAFIGSGHAAGFDIEVWRCLTCGKHESTSVRVDGQNFWVAAMARAIRSEELRIIDSYSGTALPGA
jgi:hypothetical protein